MFEQENSLDIVIAFQYAITQSDTIHDVEQKLLNIKSLLNGGDGISIVLILKIVLFSLPSLLCTSELIECIEKLLEAEDDLSENMVDAFSILGRDSETFNIRTESVERLLKLKYEQKKSLADTFISSVQETSFRYLFSPDEDSTSSNLFQSFAKALIFRVNDEFGSFDMTDSLVDTVRNSKYATLELLDWIKGFYFPIGLLSSYVNSNFSLLDYEHILPTNEVVELISIQIYAQVNSKDVINAVLIPYSKYIGEEVWNCFNLEISKFGKKCTTEKEHSRIIANYKILLDILRENFLLTQLNTVSSTIRERLVCTILTTIYLCPSAILEVFVNAKEILILLKTLSLPNSTESITLTDLNGKSFDEVSESISASYGAIDSLLHIINIGEVLYSNELSIADIIALENSDKNVQNEQLIKFINNEVACNTTHRKWEMFLRSIYSTVKRTNVFNKISTEELSEVLLIKLLDLKQFTVIKDVFSKDFNYISDEKYNELTTKHCWDSYMKATNCDRKIGFLKECSDCAALLNTDSTDSHRINSLLEVNTKLLDWKFYLNPGMPVTPKDILEVNNPFIIVRRILELNETAYMYPGDLYYILELLIDGIDAAEQSPIFSKKTESYDDKFNLLATKLKLICLEFASATDYEYSFDLGIDLLSSAIKEKYEVDGFFDLISENWFTFFQFSKNEYEDIVPLTLLKSKLKLLGKLLLVTPTEFNTIVMEQWQMLNVLKEQSESQEMDEKIQSKSLPSAEVSLGDVHTRLQRSLKSSADELFNTNSTEISKNIVGWIIGAN